jgi:OOP family OmpA-OmpF porin
MKRSVCAGALLALCVPGARAIGWSPDSAASYGAVLGSVSVPDHQRDSDYGLGGQVVFLGLPLTRGLNLEFEGFANTLKRRSDSGSDAQYGLGLNLNVAVDDGRWASYLLAGLGAEHDRLALAAEHTVTAPYVDFGAGVLLRLNAHFALRSEARYYLEFNDRSYPEHEMLGDLRVALGLQYAWGRLPGTQPQSPPEPAPAAVPTAAVAEPPPGGPADSDEDGVPDALDQCPDTPRDLRVDARGCIVEQTVVLRTLNFELGSDRLTPEAQRTLDRMARGLLTQPGLRLEIAGHTDALGPQSLNLNLSQKRAYAVRDYLIMRGVDPARLRAEGYGEYQPIASNKTEEGRAKNRRVEFKLIGD